MPPFPDIRLAVVIVNYNGARRSIQCVKSLFSGSVVPATVVVIDNASESADLGLLSEYAEAASDVLVWYNAENVGYARAVMQGLHRLCPAYDGVLVINNDCTVDEQCLQQLTKQLAAQLIDQTISSLVILPLVMDSNTERVWYAGGIAKMPLLRPVHIGYGQDVTQWQGSPSKMTGDFFACGCAFLVAGRSHVLIGLNEHFFLYWEDIEWSIALRRAGATVMVCPQARVQHEPGSSTATNLRSRLVRDLLKGHGRGVLVRRGRLYRSEQIAIGLASLIWILWEARPVRDGRDGVGSSNILMLSAVRAICLSVGFWKGIRGQAGEDLLRAPVAEISSRWLTNKRSRR